MIIACDLDRTLLPNGSEPDNASLADFYALMSQALPDAVLAYVTGRSLALYKNAQKEYGLRDPDYLLASVGTEVYVAQNNTLVPDPHWDAFVLQFHDTWDYDTVRRDVLAICTDRSFIYPQEDEVQNKYKLSFYIENPDQHKEDVLGTVHEYAEAQDLGVEIIYSFDPHKNIGLLDILPSRATKLGALEYVRNKIGVEKDEVIYCGDSGNDLLPLTAGYKAVLVGNAPAEIKQSAQEAAKKNHTEEQLYIAQSYYAAGVVEGIRHFMSDAKHADVSPTKE